MQTKSDNAATFFIILARCVVVFGCFFIGLSTWAATPMVYTGYAHTCALNVSGAVFCWGANSTGELGVGSTDSLTRLSPELVSGLSSGVVAIATGNQHTCALTNAGAVRCWGWNGSGQLGNGTTANASASVAVTGLSSGVVAISAGGQHSCALINSGAVKCWGFNGGGALGNGATTGSLTLVVTSLGGSAIAISAGGQHSCAVLGTGAVQCWGLNPQGQVGNGTNDNVAHPFPGAVLTLTTGVVAVSAGGSHTCALTSAGAMKCWGENLGGGLGNGNTLDAYSPVAVSGFSSGVAAISAGALHTSALTTSSSATCWGYNNSGQVGNGTTASTTTPGTV